MPLNGNTFTRTQSWVANAALGIKIRADLMDQDSNDIAAGISAVALAASLAAGSVSGVSTALAASGGSNLLGFIQSQATAVARTQQSKNRDTISVKDFGAIGDGSSHALSTVTALGGTNTTGWTLGQWQAFWPHVTALTNELDWGAAQAAVNTGKAIFWPDGSYVHDQPLSVSTYNQRIYANGRLATITFNLAASGAGILLSGASGRQQVFGFNLVGSTNCTKVVDYTSPQVQIMHNWITPGASGSSGIYGEDENTGSGIYNFGAQICFNYINGTRTVGSRGIRLGNNSQTTTVFCNVVTNFESHLSMEGACDSNKIECNVFQNNLATGYGIDMRGVGGSPTYKNNIIRCNHFEQMYAGSIGWGKNIVGPTYTSNVIQSNYFSGQAGQTSYALSIEGLCGAGSANNAVEFNDATNANGTAAVTTFFNFTDANGASSIISRRGNTVASGAWATGTQSIYAYAVRQLNGYFGNVVTAGVLASSAVTRLEMATGTFRVPIRSGDWLPGEYLDNIQVLLAASAGAPTVNVTLYKSSVNTTTSVVSTGAVAASGVVTLAVNTVAVQGFNYFLEFVCVAGGGTSYTYPGQLYVH